MFVVYCKVCLGPIPALGQKVVMGWITQSPSSARAVHDGHAAFDYSDPENPVPIPGLAGAFQVAAGEEFQPDAAWIVATYGDRFVP